MISSDVECVRAKFFFFTITFAIQQHLTFFNIVQQSCIEQYYVMLPRIYPGLTVGFGSKTAHEKVEYRLFLQARLSRMYFLCDDNAVVH